VISKIDFVLGLPETILDTSDETDCHALIPVINKTVPITIRATGKNLQFIFLSFL